jgi:hypothetical protein
MRHNGTELFSWTACAVWSVDTQTYGIASFQQTHHHSIGFIAQQANPNPLSLPDFKIFYCAFWTLFKTNFG